MKALWLLGLAAVFGLGVWCAASTNPIVKLVGAFVFGLLSLAFTALTVLVIWVGVKNNWTSDGPGMLLVMIAVPVFGFIALAGWRFALGLAFGGKGK